MVLPPASGLVENIVQVLVATNLPAQIFYIFHGPVGSFVIHSLPAHSASLPLLRLRPSRRHIRWAVLPPTTLPYCTPWARDCRFSAAAALTATCGSSVNFFNVAGGVEGFCAIAQRSSQEDDR